MDHIDNLEEPPPFERYVPPVDNSRKPGLFAGRSSRISSSGKSWDLGALPRARSNTSVIVIAATLAVVILSMQFWILHRLSSVRAELMEVRSGLKETRGSLGVVWQATRRLGEDRTERISVLADSLRRLLERADGEARLLEASYASFGRQVAETDKAMMTMTRGLRSVYTRLEAQRSRLDALERSDRTHTSAIEALSRRTQSQQRSTRDD